MTSDEHVPRFMPQAIAHPFSRIIRLKMPGSRELRERIRCTPENLGGLLRAKLPAVPYDVWSHSSRGRRDSDLLTLVAPCRRQRTPHVDVGTHSLTVMNQIKAQGMAC